MLAGERPLPAATVAADRLKRLAVTCHWLTLDDVAIACDIDRGELAGSIDGRVPVRLTGDGQPVVRAMDLRAVGRRLHVERMGAYSMVLWQEVALRRYGCQNDILTSVESARIVGQVTTRDTAFPLRFKNPANRDALRHIAELTGRSMTDIAEQAIEHEVVLLAADLDARLSQALDIVRRYQPDRDFDRYVEAAAEGERAGLDPMRNTRRASPSSETTISSDPFGVAAAFARS